ncbi:MAG: hypothetical protein HFF90_03955 [Oscillibacter sp.]|nr:hypothetical protein [Oscillibacter sp.]
MKELTQIRDAVITALQGAGLRSEAAYPDRRVPKCTEALASVSVGAAEGRALGFCNYLGECADEHGGLRELYGKQLEGQITVEIRAERAQTCEDGCETASGVLLGSLPEGIAPGELRWEAMAWERETGLFLRKGTLSCQALFTAWAGEDSEFLDFILKGAMKT